MAAKIFVSNLHKETENDFFSKIKILNKNKKLNNNLYIFVMNN
jgi:hypothetical protein